MTSPDPRPRWTKKRYRVPAVAVLLLAALYANNSSATIPDSDGPEVLAHRGAAQTFDVAGLEADTCTAERIHDPRHDYLENTLAGIRAAFASGADTVELDVHITADEQFAVFHDWEVDCRTDGSGTTRDFTMAELKELDIGYGYTPDDGKSYPFRGQGMGMMPSLDETLAEFDSQSLLIHVKSDDSAEGEALAGRLSQLDDERLDNISVYGGDAPIAAIREAMPRLRVMSMGMMKNCLAGYVASGAAGIVPGSCRNTQLHLPESYAKWLWGWSSKFTTRMASVDTTVVLVAGSGEWSEGFDTPESLERIPAGYSGMVWTNNVTEMAPLIARL